MITEPAAQHGIAARAFDFEFRRGGHGARASGQKASTGVFNNKNINSKHQQQQKHQQQNTSTATNINSKQNINSNIQEWLSWIVIAEPRPHWCLVLAGHSDSLTRGLRKGGSPQRSPHCVPLCLDGLTRHARWFRCALADFERRSVRATRGKPRLR